MTKIDQVRQTIEPYLERVRSFEWTQPRAGGAPFGVVESSVVKWMRSIEAKRWDSLRIEWRNQLVDLTADVDTDLWNGMVRMVREELNKAIPTVLGGTPKKCVLDTTRWDLLLAWQSKALGAPADWRYFRIFEAYESGWLVGGPVETVSAETDSLDVLLVLEVAKNRAVLLTD